MQVVLKVLGWALIVAGVVSPYWFRDLAEMLFVYFGLLALGIVCLYTSTTWHDGVIALCKKHDYCSFAHGHVGKCNTSLMGSWEHSDWMDKQKSHNRRHS